MKMDEKTDEKIMENEWKWICCVLVVLYSFCFCFPAIVQFVLSTTLFSSHFVILFCAHGFWCYVISDNWEPQVAHITCSEDFLISCPGHLLWWRSKVLMILDALMIRSLRCRLRARPEPRILIYKWSCTDEQHTKVTTDGFGKALWLQYFWNFHHDFHFFEPPKNSSMLSAYLWEWMMLLLLMMMMMSSL